MDTAYILQVLLPYLIALYIIDSVTYIGKHQRLFVSSFGNRFKVRSVGFRLAGLSPFCQAFDSHTHSVYLTREGIHIPINRYGDERTPCQREDLQFFPYGELHTVESAGKTIRINGDISLKTASPALSRIITRRLEGLRNAEKGARENVYRNMIEGMTDVRSLASKRAELSRQLFTIGLPCCALFLIVFAILPLAVYRLVPLNVSYLLFCMAPVYCFIIGVTYLFHRRHFTSEGAERTYLLFTMLLLPVSAIHVVSRLTRRFLAGYDFLTVAAVLLPKDALRSLLRREIEFTRIALTGDIPGDLREYWSEREGILHRLVEGAGLSLEEICREPARYDRDATKYCPLCYTEYCAGFDVCSDCRVDLRAFKVQQEREKELSA